VLTITEELKTVFWYRVQTLWHADSCWSCNSFLLGFLLHVLVSLKAAKISARDVNFLACSYIFIFVYLYLFIHLFTFIYTCINTGKYLEQT